jgi:hypothetical protein
MIFANILRRYFNIGASFSNDLIQTAYHKSGHILLAYSYGYSCHRLDLKERDNIDIHFKDDLMLVAGILSYGTETSLFHSLPAHTQKRAEIVAERLISMLTAGYLAQKKLEKGESSLFKEGEDLLSNPPESIQRINQFLKSFKSQDSDPYAKSFSVQALTYFLSRPQNWKPVDRLARELLYSPSKTLDQNTIDKIIRKNSSLHQQGHHQYFYTFPSTEIKNSYATPNQLREVSG